MSGIMGAKSGFIHAAAKLLCWIVAISATFFASPHVASKIKTNFSMSDLTSNIVAALVSFLVFMMISGIIRNFIVSSLSWVGGGTVDRLLGFIFGCGKGALYIGIFILCVYTYAIIINPNNSGVSSNGPKMPTWLEKSTTYRLLSGEDELPSAPSSVAKVNRRSAPTKRKSKNNC